MKRLIAWTMIAAALMTLTACGDKKQDAGEKAPATNAAQTEAAQETPNVSDEAPKDTPEVQSGKLTVEELNAAPVTSEEDIFCESDGKEEFFLMYTGTSPLLVMPDTYKGQPITKITQYSFNKEDTIVRGIKLSDSIRELEEYSCGDCATLEVVIFGKSVEIVGDFSFAFSEKLHTVILNEGLQSIGKLAFSSCESLMSIYIPSSVTEIAESAFFNCPKELVIYGEAGSYAETYAKENNINFEVK